MENRPKQCHSHITVLCMPVKFRGYNIVVRQRCKKWLELVAERCLTEIRAACSDTEAAHRTTDELSEALSWIPEEEIISEKYLTY